MQNFSRIPYLFILTICLLNSCAKESPEKITPVVIGIPSDVESLNPLFSFTGYETILTELLYPALVQYEWNDGKLDFFPMLAESWKWNEDSSSVTFYLRKDAAWRDGKPVTAADVVFALDAYSDPLVQSRLFGTFDHFNLEKDLQIDLQKTFEIKNPYELKINFREDAVPDLKYFDMPVIPAHVFGSFDRGSLITIEKGLDSITCGAFYLYKWDKNQAIVLRRDEQSYLTERGNLSELIFKIIPDYNSRLLQLKSGEIDLMEDIKTADIQSLEKKGLEVEPVEGKEYDYIGWNNINPELYVKGKIVPHPLFGDAEIRKALTLAVNCREIFREFLESYGSLASGPVSPIFTDFFNNDLLPAEYDANAARKILIKNGWEDKNRNGVIEKNGKEFSFTLNIPSGNPRREFAAAIIKNNLMVIGINAEVEQLEPGVFFDKMFAHQLDAWIAGWLVPVPLELAPYWSSDLTNTPLNVAGYRSNQADSLLNLISRTSDHEKKASYVREFQEVLYKDNPVTFMYWIDNIAAYNKRVENIKITPLGPFHHCWTWSVK